MKTMLHYCVASTYLESGILADAMVAGDDGSTGRGIPAFLTPDTCQLSGACGDAWHTLFRNNSADLTITHQTCGLLPDSLSPARDYLSQQA